ncbi:MULTISPECIES: sulfur carrier protein ThiS [Anaerofustis]|uniref:sulfur carrier protein ThiS n=1 Tax=Anaerofustis TaxID=264995 RepID=UPI0011073F3C|nr:MULTISPECIES: sulfur carrier protein ThiS [Anaerofustis]MCO8194490.1 sulfur carrier protein ThiS [Anaerofustis sp. NSJ-163]
MIKINGQDTKLSDISLKELLEKCNFDSEKVAVELNEEIISKKDFDKIKIKDNDKIEVVSFVGGG